MKKIKIRFSHKIRRISTKNFTHGIEYLKNCDISQKKTFINEFFLLAFQRFAI
jgi:hypothetical protein